jgi:hypothetical protein
MSGAIQAFWLNRNVVEGRWRGWSRERTLFQLNPRYQVNLQGTLPISVAKSSGDIACLHWAEENASESCRDGDQRQRHSEPHSIEQSYRPKWSNTDVMQQRR